MPFDNICKRLAEFYPRDFASWLLGEPVAEVEVEKTELSNEPIRADSLILLRLSSRFLHIEFQTTPRSRPPLPLRMLDYWVRWYRDYGISVIQFVVLLRDTGEDAPSEFRAPNTWHRYNVVKVWEQEPERFLRSPGLMPLAVLARSDEPERLFAQVAERVLQVAPDQGRSELVGCVALLAGLRFEHDLIYHLLPEEIMEESVIYQDILRKGELRGEIRGEARGEIKGELRMILRILKHRFGALAPEIEGKIKTLDKDSIEALGVAQINFQQLSDLENWLAEQSTQM